MVKLLMQDETENQDGGRFKKQVCPQQILKNPPHCSTHAI